MLVLGVETSCDETGLALYDSEKGLLGHLVYTQVLHAEFGGVVPELASRDHIRKTLPMLKQLLQTHGVALDALGGVAYTAGPGLAGALLVGAAIARSLAWALEIPAIGVHHMEGHLLAPLLDADTIAFPFVALLVSGGHTLLVMVEGIGQYRILGESIDDAVGEAFDKTAKILGLPYPGGPELAKLAVFGNSERFRFPRPMTDRPGLDFSFSGLKTFALNTYQTHINDPDIKQDVARAFEDAVVDTLLIKSRRAIKQTRCKTFIVAGGVSANRQLRAALDTWAKKEKISLHFPRAEFCTDNGAMIAFAGYLRLAAGESVPPAFGVKPRWEMTELVSPGV